MVCMANIQWNDRLAACLPPLSDEQREGLEADILREGCLSPLFVWNGTLVDGHQRYRICQKHGIPFEVRHLRLESLDQACFWALRHHKNRRNVSLYTLTECALQLESEIAARAKENQRTRKKGQPGACYRRIRRADTVNTNRELAKEAGVSHDTIGRVKYLRDHADETTKQRLRDNKTTINAEYTKLRSQEGERQREIRRTENAKRIPGATSLDDLRNSSVRFATIVLDPPWDRGEEGYRHPLSRTPASMSLAKLLALPVGMLADQDCHLYLWITNRLLPKGFLLLERWGFRYVTMLTWCKPSFGTGSYFRGSTEHVLFGVRGSQPLNRTDVGTWFAAPQGSLGHSSKPVAFYDLVESCSPGPYLEMFARSQRPGWVSWWADANGSGISVRLPAAGNDHMTLSQGVQNA